jgi:hypothetical protein
MTGTTRGRVQVRARAVESPHHRPDAVGAGIAGYLAGSDPQPCINLARHRRWIAHSDTAEAEEAVRLEASSWLSGYVFGVVYRRRNRWWWQRLRSHDVPADMSRLTFVLHGVGQIGDRKSWRLIRERW